MPRLLEGCLAKLDRATETTRQFERESASFLADSGPRFEVVKGFLDSDSEYAFKVRGKSDLPPRLSVLVGEVVHQIRSSLDHLITALVLASGGSPTKKHAFPVAKTQTAYDDAIKKGYIGGVSASAAALIHSCQPLHAVDPEDHFLAVLHYLDIIDKHRLLLIVAAAACFEGTASIGTDEVLARQLGVNPGRTITNFRDFVPRRLSSEWQTVFSIELAAPDPTMTVDGQVLVDSVFPECGRVQLIPVTAALDGMQRATTSLIHSFVNEF